MREYCCSRTSVAQLADRRVGLDGDDVGPRRHHLAHHRFAELDERPQQLARLPFLQVSWSARRFGDVGRLGRRRASRSPLRSVPGAPRPGGRRQAAQRDGQRPQHAGDGSNDGSRSSSTRSGSRRTMTSGTMCSQIEHEQRRCRASGAAGRARRRRRSRARAGCGDDGDDGQEQPRRDEEPQWLVEIAAERVAAPPRSAIRRSDSRISALNAVVTVLTYTADRPRRNSRSGVIAGCSGDQPCLSARPSCAAAPRAAPSRRRPSRDRSRAGAAGRAAPGPRNSVRHRVAGLVRLPLRDAVAMTMSPR